MRPIPRLLIWLLSKCSGIRINVQMEQEPDPEPNMPTFYPSHPDILMDDVECELAANYLEYCFAISEDS